MGVATNMSEPKELVVLAAEVEESPPATPSPEQPATDELQQLRRNVQRDLDTMDQPRIGSMYTLPRSVLDSEPARTNINGGRRRTVLKHVVRGSDGGYMYYPAWTDRKTGQMVRSDKSVYMSKVQLDVMRATGTVPGCLTGCNPRPVAAVAASAPTRLSATARKQLEIQSLRAQMRQLQARLDELERAP